MKTLIIITLFLSANANADYTDFSNGTDKMYQYEQQIRLNQQTYDIQIQKQQIQQLQNQYQQQFNAQERMNEERAFSPAHVTNLFSR